MNTVAINVVEIESGNVVHSVDVRSKTESQVERVFMGMMTQLNSDDYYLDEVEE